MSLCDNIFSLINSMTRVEKYRRYREEISNMKFETFTLKKEACEQVERIQKTQSGNRLNFEDVMEIHQVFEENPTKHKKNRLIPITKFELFYSLIAISLFTLTLLALIFTGMKIWG